MSDYFHVAGIDWDELHIPGPRIPDPADPTKTTPGPSVMVARVLVARGARADVAQGMAEALNAIDKIEALLATLPVATRNSAAGLALTAALEKARRVPRP